MATVTPSLRAVLSANLRSARARAKLSVEQAAAAAGITLDAWYKIERGDRWPREDVLVSVAAAVDVPPWRLIRPTAKKIPKEF